MSPSASLAAIANERGALSTMLAEPSLSTLMLAAANSRLSLLVSCAGVRSGWPRGGGSWLRVNTKGGGGGGIGGRATAGGGTGGRRRRKVLGVAAARSRHREPCAAAGAPRR